jgi:WD40 repeat protein
MEDSSMKIPRFELSRVDEDGTREPPRIVPVTRLPWEAKIDRRGFLGAAVMAGAALAAASCSGTSYNQYSRAHKDRVYGLAISPDGKLLTSRARDFSGLDSTKKLWSLPDGALMKTLKEKFTSDAIGSDGKLKVSVIYKTIELLRNGELKTLEGHKASVYSVAIHPDGKLLASGSQDKTVKLWSLPDGALMKTLEGHEGAVRSVAFSPDGKLLASGSGDGTVKLWSLPDGDSVKSIGGENYGLPSVSSIAIRPDDKLLASGHEDGSIILWSLPRGRLLARLIDLAVSPDTAKGSTYAVTDKATGQTVTYTQPCGSPIPSGATCKCDCVPGRVPTGSLGGYGGGGGRCVCMAVRCR